MESPSVTLPLPDILAQAPELSPWWGLHEDVDFDAVMVRTLDELGEADRMQVALRIDEATPTPRLLLVGLARHGWFKEWTRRGMMRASGLSEDGVSRALTALVNSGIIRIDRNFFPAGAQSFLVTISGTFIRRGYDRILGAGAENALAAQPQERQGNAVSAPRSAGQPSKPARGKSGQLQLPDGQPQSPWGSARRPRRGNRERGNRERGNRERGNRERGNRERGNRVTVSQSVS